MTSKEKEVAGEESDAITYAIDDVVTPEVEVPESTTKLGAAKVIVEQVFWYFSIPN